MNGYDLSPNNNNNSKKGKHCCHQVLVVDDNAFNVKSLELILQHCFSLGCDVVS